MTAEDAYWVDQAALLDPAAYETINAVGWSRTVPTGEAWYAVAMGSVDWGNNHKSGYVRRFDVRTAVMLPEGTTIRPVAGQAASVHLCRPQLVATDDRYTDPKTLYYERIQRLKTLPIIELYAEIANGSPFGTTGRADFPADFGHGMIVGASVYDAAWVTLSGWNMLDEVNNQHPVRFATGLLAPFPRAQMPYLFMRGANRAGDLTSPCISGAGTVLYQKLPEDW